MTPLPLLAHKLLDGEGRGGFGVRERRGASSFRAEVGDLTERQALKRHHYNLQAERIELAEGGLNNDLRAIPNKRVSVTACIGIKLRIRLMRLPLLAG